jgi:dTDP-4-amino-4,6-dideoxygalactose transaminase
LQHVDAFMARRAVIAARYRERLAGIRGVTVPEVDHPELQNNSYFPVFIEADYPLSRDGLYTALQGDGIMTRRYFYPLISEFPMYRGLPSARTDNLPVAHHVANRVLCLPIYPDLPLDDVDRVCAIIRRRSQA